MEDQLLEQPGFVSHWDDSVEEVESESGDGAQATAMGSVKMALVSHSYNA